MLGTAYSLAYNGTAWITKAGHEYDLKGKLTKQTDANGTVVSNTPAYDGYGRLTRSTDPLGHYSVYLYDEMDRLTRELFYESGGAAGFEPPTTNCVVSDSSISSLSRSGHVAPEQSGAQSGAPADPALIDVMSGWAELPPAIRAGILAMIEAAKNEPKG